MKMTNRYGKSCVTNDHGCVPFVVIIIPSIPRSWPITGAYNKTKSMEATSGTGTATLPEHLSSLPVLVGFYL